MPEAWFLQTWPQFRMTGVSFIYVFLPLALFVYYGVSHRMRPTILTLISLLYCYLAQPWSAVLLLASVVSDYIAVRAMARYDGDEGLRKLFLVFSVVKNLLVIFATGALYESGKMPFFFGAVVYSVSSLDAMLTFYRREYPCERNFSNFALYCSFFPRLYAGPIQPYREFAVQLPQIHFNFKSLMVGAGQFAQGGVKTALFAAQFTALYATARQLHGQDPSVLSAWLCPMLFALAAYYALSGFCDMAQGIGAMFGLFLPKNFYYPYQSRGVIDFFQRFHITLGALLRRDVYGPLQGESRNRAADCLNILLTGMLFGLWFGPRINYLLWGVYLALFFMGERYLYPNLPRKIPTLLMRLGTLAVVVAGFAVMLGQGPGESLLLLRDMLGLGGLEPAGKAALYLISSNWMLLAAAAFFCTNIVNVTMLWLHKNTPRLADILLTACNILLMVVLTAILL